MGYEVLDSRGESVRVLDDEPPVTALDVVHLESLPAPVEEVAARPWPARRERLIAVWRSTSTGTGRRAAGTVTVVVVASMADGALVSAVLVRRHEQGQQLAQQRSALSATATVTDFTPSSVYGSTTVSLTAQLTNVGRLPISVLTGALTGGGSVDVIGDSSVAPGTTVLVTVQKAPVDCSSEGGDDAVAIPVRTADRSGHQVEVSFNSLGVPNLAAAACTDTTGGQIQAALIGPITDPVLRVSNVGDEPLRLSLSAPGGSDAEGPPLLILSTQPVLPVELAPRQRRDLHLVVTATRCPDQVAELDNGLQAAEIVGVGADANDTSSSWFPIGPLVGAAVAKVCD